jgi:uncharacterized membrane protein
MHEKPDQHHTREQFQVDRIAFFSDAIIAIAITLLVLEIKIPPLGGHATWQQVKTAYLKQLFFPFMGMGLSFLLIGRLWIRHHEIFEHVIAYNRVLVRFNLYFLFSVVLLPVSTMFMMDENNPKNVSFVVFMINLALCHFFFLLLIQMLLNKKNHFYSEGSEHIIRQQRTDCLEFLIVLIGVAVITMYEPLYVQYFVYVYVAYRVYRRLRNRAKKKKEEHHKKMPA